MVKAEPSLNSANGTTRSSSPVDIAGLAGLPGMERDKDRATYLQQLIKDQKTCLSYPNVFHHVERLLAEGTEERLYLDFEKGRGTFWECIFCSKLI